MNIPPSFKRTLEMYRRRKERGTAGALKYVADQIVASLEEAPKSAKITAIHTLFSIFGSVFTRLSLPSEVLFQLPYFVDLLISNEGVEKAETLLGAPFPPVLAVPIMELKMKLYLGQGNTAEFEKVFRLWKAQQTVIYAETAQMFGYRELDDGSWTQDETWEATHLTPLEATEEATEEATNIAPLEITHIASHEAPHNTIEETGEQKLLADEIARVVRAKKHKKRKESVVMVEENEGYVRTLEEAKVAEGSGTILVKERRHSRFQICLDVSMEELDDKSYVGSMKTNTTNVRKYFIVAQHPQIQHMQDLVDLCLTHTNFVKIDQSLCNMDDEKRVLSTSENVCSVEWFFTRKLSALSPQSVNSNEAWWRNIELVFWKVFRGIVRGIMHLFVKEMSCGDIVFCCFVTSGGEGRILPSMEKKKQITDLVQLADLMTTVIRLCVPCDSDLAFLPNELKHFFWMIAHFKDTNEKRLLLPLEFLVDHPYFWNRKERIDFSFNLWKKLKEIPKDHKSSNYYNFNSQLEQSSLYEEWWSKLTDVYLAIYNRNETRKHEYKKNVDIVFYVCAIYSLINGREYRTARANKKFLEEEIESKLDEYFPNYHMDMFYHLCICRQMNDLDDEDLMCMSSVYSQGVELRRYT